MLTDRQSRRAGKLLSEFHESDRLGSLDLPPDDRLPGPTLHSVCNCFGGETPPLQSLSGRIIRLGVAFMRSVQRAPKNRRSPPRRDRLRPPLQRTQ